MSNFVHSYTSESVHICVDIYKKVINGTGETLLYPHGGERKPISICEMVDCKEGVGGGHSTNDYHDNTT